MFQKILVCLDGSRLAEQILPFVEAQAQCFGSRVILFQVYDIHGTNIATAGFSPPADKVIQAELEGEAHKATEYLETIAQSLRQKGIDVICVTLRGSPGETIIGYAKNEPVDLIAIATHGRSGLGRVFFGSVAEYVMRNSGKPVLAIKPQ